MRLGLIAARVAKGWSQDMLAKAVGKHDRSSIAHYEKGDCDIPGKVLQQMSALLGRPMDVLLKRHDVQETPLGTVQESSHA